MTATRSVSRLWPQNALRPPDWRWQQAVAIVDGDADTRTIPTPDSRVLAAVEFLVNGPQGSEATGPTHNIYRAHAIWEAAGWDRCLVESRLLSGASTEDAAELLQLTEDVVMAYQDLFFDVSDRLLYRSFVVHAAIRAPRDGVPAKLESAVTSFAYFGGPHVLDAVIAAHANVIEPDGLVDAALAMEIDAALAKSVRTAVQTWITPVTVCNAEEWLGLYIDQLAAELVGGRKRSLRNIDAALRRMNRSGRPEKDTDSSPDKREEVGFEGVDSNERQEFNSPRSEKTRDNISCSTNRESHGVGTTQRQPVLLPQSPNAGRSCRQRLLRQRHGGGDRGPAVAGPGRTETT